MHANNNYRGALGYFFAVHLDLGRPMWTRKAFEVDAAGLTHAAAARAAQQAQRGLGSSTKIS